MKSLTFSTCIIAMLLVTSVSFGEIIEYTKGYYWWESYGDWHFDTSGDDSVEADVDAGSEYPYSVIRLQRWIEYTVTVDNTYCDWNYELSSSTYVSAQREDYDPHSATAHGYAYVSSPHCTNYAVTYNSIDENWSPLRTFVEDDDYKFKSDSGSGWFDEGESLYLDHQVNLEAEITEDSDDSAHAAATASASGELTEGELP
ncbi:MAG: hypothetical protein ACYSWQ_24195 [Planctomycetota bacterium]|jgi:hypothetical protein